MNNILEYKGYQGSVEYSPEDGVLFGKVLGVRSLVSYEGRSVDELKEDFEQAVEAYLEDCEERGITPEKTYKGSVNVRLSPETHRLAGLIASAEHISLNQFIEQSVKAGIKAYHGGAEIPGT